MNGQYKLVFLITLLFQICGSLKAQTQTIDSLRSIITVKEDSLARLNEKEKRIMHSFDILNTEIFRQKKEMETSSNPLVRLRLNGDLKESESIATELEKLQKQKLHIRRKLQSHYLRIIAVADSIVKQKIQTVRNQQISRAQVLSLNLIHLLENEKKVWQKKLTESTPFESEWPLLEIETGDNIERLQLKIQLAQDRILQTHSDLKKIVKRRAELHSDLQIYEEMLSFMDNLQQSIDPEQEYFDQERIDHIKDDVRNIKLKISEIDERLLNLKEDEKKLVEKLQHFKNYLENKLKS